MVVGFINKITQFAIPSFFGKIICGDRYLNPIVDGFIERTCGGRADMFFGAFLILVFIIGVVLLIIGMAILLTKKIKGSNEGKHITKL